jgi:hypothetical protein
MIDDRIDMGDDIIDVAYLVTLALLTGKYSSMGPERVGRRTLPNQIGLGMNSYGRGLHSPTFRLDVSTSSCV